MLVHDRKLFVSQYAILSSGEEKWVSIFIQSQTLRSLQLKTSHSLSTKNPF